jgi:integrase
MGRVFNIKRKRSVTWYIEFYHDNKQHREKVGCSKDGIKEKHAKEALQARMGDIAKGKFDIAQTKTYPAFSKFMDKYLEWSESRKRSFKRDMTSSKHLRPFFKNKKVNEIDPLMIERYIRNRKAEIKAMKKNRGKIERDVSFASINREIALLKHLYSKAIEWRIVDKNPVKCIKMLSEKRRERYLKNDEINALLEACETNKNKCLKVIIMTAIGTGGRLNEILNIKVKDVDFRNSKINLEHTKTGENGKLTMSEHLKEVLIDHLKNNNNFNNEYLFCKSNGEPFKDIKTAFKNALKQAGIKDFRFHDLRHTFASHLAMNGVEGRTLQEMGRWKTPGMVMRYAHLSTEHMKKAANSLDNLFKNKLDLSNNLIQADFASGSESG